MIPLPKTCISCPLYSEHKGFSRLEGDGSSGLMVIAESLGRNEERDSLPLRPNAPSGGVFQKAVDMSGLSRPSRTLTNIIRCKAEAPYPPEAVAQCRQYLDAAVEERKPSFILALGDVPLQELSLIKGQQSSLRGYVLPSRYNIPMIATFHLESHEVNGTSSVLSSMTSPVR
jgi:uracil-DNA glycosylase family 4